MQITRDITTRSYHRRDYDFNPTELPLLAETASDELRRIPELTSRMVLSDVSDIMGLYMQIAFICMNTQGSAFRPIVMHGGPGEVYAGMQLIIPMVVDKLEWYYNTLYGQWRLTVVTTIKQPEPPIGESL